MGFEIEYNFKPPPPSSSFIAIGQPKRFTNTAPTEHSPANPMIVHFRLHHPFHPTIKFHSLWVLSLQWPFHSMSIKTPSSRTNQYPTKRTHPLAHQQPHTHSETRRNRAQILCAVPRSYNTFCAPVSRKRPAFGRWNSLSSSPAMSWPASSTTGFPHHSEKLDAASWYLIRTPPSSHPTS